VAREVLGSFNIKQWVDGTAYAYGDLVWYDGENNDSLYLLRSIEDRNYNRPKIVLLSDGKPDDSELNQSGWSNQNRYVSLVELGIENMIKRQINAMLIGHCQSAEHRYGRMDLSTIDKKILRTDLSNRDQSRKKHLFPYETKFLPQDDSILGGFARRYDNGLLEYDIIFRLSYTGTESVDGASSNILKANSVNVRNTSTFSKQNVDYNNNEQYFQTPNDYQIFNAQSSGEIELGPSRQTNRMPFVNVYHADLHLLDNQKFIFRDNNYMVFCSDVLSQDRDVSQKSINPGSNSIVFINKSSKMLTAVCVTYPKPGT
jgi:hypothetical protein